MNSNPKNRPTDFYSLGWVPLPAFAVLCIVMIFVNGCTSVTSPVATKEEALVALGVSIEQISNQVLRMSEQGSIDAGTRALAKSHLQTAIEAGVAAGDAIVAGNEAGFYPEIQTANAALAAVRSILKEFICNESRSDPRCAQGG